MYQPASYVTGRSLPTSADLAYVPFSHGNPAHWPIRGWQAVAKRLIDIVVALVGLLVAGIPLLIAAIAIHLESPGPILFRQRRIGFANVGFEMWKLRTMYHVPVQPGRLLQARRDDPRITRVGAWLRRSSLDELPQLINVLRGHMSLVGPRPPLPREVARYETHVHRRLLVKPGLTGLWQISGRSDLSWEETVRLDLRYVENWSIATDLLILWKTARAVVAGSGAY